MVRQWRTLKHQPHPKAGPSKCAKSLSEKQHTYTHTHAHAHTHTYTRNAPNMYAHAHTHSRTYPHIHKECTQHARTRRHTACTHTHTHSCLLAYPHVHKKCTQHAHTQTHSVCTQAHTLMLTRIPTHTQEMHPTCTHAHAHTHSCSYPDINAPNMNACAHTQHAHAHTHTCSRAYPHIHLNRREHQSIQLDPQQMEVNFCFLSGPFQKDKLWSDCANSQKCWLTEF